VDCPSRARCGFRWCKNLSTKSGVFKMTNGQHETKSWCSSHKWCSYHRRIELLGTCANRKKTDAKINRKVIYPSSWPKFIQ
jgi:hypothetical protein